MIVKYKQQDYEFKELETTDIMLAQNKMPTGFLLLDAENKPRAPVTEEEKDLVKKGEGILSMLIFAQLSVKPKLTWQQLQKDPLLFFAISKEFMPVLSSFFL